MNGYHGGFPDKCAYYIPAGWTDWFGLQTIGFGACQAGSRVPAGGPGQSPVPCQPVVVNENGNSVVYPTSAYQTDVLANISINWLQNTWERGKKPCATLRLPPRPLGRLLLPSASAFALFALVRCVASDCYLRCLPSSQSSRG